MATTLAEIDDGLRSWIAAQPMFFVATAPLAAGGHVNCSPKGLDSFAVLDPTTVAWLDFVGSGAETIAHLRENGRICVMFCAFADQPRILRLHGRGAVVEPPDPGFPDLLAHFPRRPDVAARSIVRIDVTRIASSCGYGVPLLRQQGARDQLTAWCARKGPQGLADYQRAKNRHSIDGLPALRWPDDEPPQC